MLADLMKAAGWDAGSRWQAAASAQEQSQIAPPVPIPDLNFLVDQLFCVGETPPDLLTILAKELHALRSGKYMLLPHEV